MLSWLGWLIEAWWEFLARLSSAKPGSGAMCCAAFVRYGGADDLGHVGWAFDFNDAEAHAGAVENTQGTPRADPSQMGYWGEFSSNPAPLMQAKGYNDLKFVNLVKAKPAAAYGVAKWIATQPYDVAGRNCLDDTYDVLRAYGVQNLPLPPDVLLPNAWIAEFHGTLAHAASYEWPHTHKPTWRSKFGRAVANAAPVKVPTWRRKGHPDHTAFELERAERRKRESSEAPNAKEAGK